MRFLTDHECQRVKEWASFTSVQTFLRIKKEREINNEGEDEEREGDEQREGGHRGRAKKERGRVNNAKKITPRRRALHQAVATEKTC